MGRVERDEAENVGELQITEYSICNTKGFRFRPIRYLIQTPMESCMDPPG